MLNLAVLISPLHNRRLPNYQRQVVCRTELEGEYRLRLEAPTLLIFSRQAGKRFWTISKHIPKNLNQYHYQGRPVGRLIFSCLEPSSLQK
jgi:hypothetical protein